MKKIVITVVVMITLLAIISQTPIGYRSLHQMFKDVTRF